MNAVPFSPTPPATGAVPPRPRTAAAAAPGTTDPGTPHASPLPPNRVAENLPTQQEEQHPQHQARPESEEVVAPLRPPVRPAPEQQHQDHNDPEQKSYRNHCTPPRNPVSLTGCIHGQACGILTS